MQNINISNMNIQGDLNIINGNLVGGQFKHEKGNGKVIVQSLDNIINSNDIHSLKVKGSLSVLLNVDPLVKEKTLIITGEVNILPFIEITNNAGILNVGFKSNTSISTNKPLEVICQVPSLDSIQVTGSGEVNGNYQGTKLSIEVAGSGSIKLFGRAENMEANVVGSGMANMKNFMVQHAQLKVKGSGSAESYALQSIDANVSGSGEIKICGTYNILNQKISGSGNISVKNNYTPKNSSLNFSTIIQELKYKIDQQGVESENVENDEYNKKQTLFQKIKKFF